MVGAPGIEPVTPTMVWNARPAVTALTSLPSHFAPGGRHRALQRGLDLGPAGGRLDLGEALAAPVAEAVRDGVTGRGGAARALLRLAVEGSAGGDGDEAGVLVRREALPVDREVRDDLRASGRRQNGADDNGLERILPQPGRRVGKG